MKKETIRRILESEHWDAFSVGLEGSAIVFVLLWSILRWHPIGGMNLVISLFIATFVGPVLWYNLLKILFELLFKKINKCISSFNKCVSPFLLLGALTLLIPIVIVYKPSLIEIFMLLGVSFLGSFLSRQMINRGISD